MATLQAATTSTGAVVSDPQAVRQLCENHCFGTLTWEVDEEGELIIWGYDAEIYETREDGLPDYEGGIVTHKFEHVIESISQFELLVAGVVSSLEVGDCNDDPQTQSQEHLCSCVNAASGAQRSEAAVLDRVVGTFDSCTAVIRLI